MRTRGICRLQVRTCFVATLGGVLLAWQASLGLGGKHDFAGATHGCPVVSIGGSTQEADLVVLPIGTAVRPRKLVRTELSKKSLEESGRHGLSFSFAVRTYTPRPLGPGSQASQITTQCWLKVTQHRLACCARRCIAGGPRDTVWSNYCPFSVSVFQRENLT